MTEVRGQKSEDRRQITEFGSRTRRRPIGRDYAAAKDAEVGKIGRSIRLRILDSGLQNEAGFNDEC